MGEDHRYVAFYSRANNLHPDDTDHVIDVYVYDRDTDTLELISKSSTGVKGNGDSSRASISADGRFVAFQSKSNNLDLADLDTVDDIYVYDRQSDEISLMSRAADGTKANDASQEPVLSPDASLLMFLSHATNLDGPQSQFQVFVKETGLGTPQSLLAALIDQVVLLDLQNGIEMSLDAKLDAAVNALDDLNANNDAAAINSLGAFVNAVEAQSGNKISVADANALIAAAQNIIDAIIAQAT